MRSGENRVQRPRSRYRVFGAVPPVARSRCSLRLNAPTKPRPEESLRVLAAQNVPGRCDHRSVVSPEAERPSQRGETWNDTDAINRHRALTPSQRVALAIEISRAALRFAQGERVIDDAADVRA
jgi:hypothetical protein